jgi:site-specific DNA-methyltransferase (adenine-specific)
MLNQILVGDNAQLIKTIPDSYVNTIITSPPYYGLRDYGNNAQLGLESTPDEYISKLVNLFNECRRVLKNDGTLWVNLGDSYDKDKNLYGMPWRLALALKDDGWTAGQSDSARYKQLGNAVTVSVVAWIVNRMVSVDEANTK